jgi:glyoxylate carboligase
MNASDFLVKRLCDWGVRRIFGYPGDGINGVMEALNRARDKIEFIQTRHEEIAAFMACGDSDVSRAVGEMALLPAARAADKETLLISEGFSCRMQIHLGTGRPVLHPAEVIAQGMEITD